MRAKPMAVLFLTVFLDLLGFGILIPLLPFVATSTGAGPVQVTILMASYSLMQFLMAPVWGSLSDRVGRRPVLLASIAGSIASLTLFAFSTTYGMLLLARILHGAMNANLAVAQAAIVDLTTPGGRAKGLGLFGAAFGLGFVLGPAIGGLLGHESLRTAALAAALLGVVNLGSALLLLPETKRPGGGDARRAWRLVDSGLWRAPERSRLRTLLATTALATLGFAAMESVFSLWTADVHGWGPLENGLLFAYLGIVIVIVQGGLIGALRRRFGERALVRAGMAGVAVGLALLPLGASLWAIVAITGLLAASQGILQPSLSALVSHEASAEEVGRVMGAHQSANALARVAGPLLAGVAFGAIAPGAPFVLGALAVAAGAGLLATLPRERLAPRVAPSAEAPGEVAPGIE